MKYFQNVSRGVLRLLAAFVWYLGGTVLLLKGSSLLIEANALRPEENLPWFAAAAALLIGGLKGKFIFTKSCQNNLDRIDALKQPKIWQLFRPGFFFALTLMIIAGAVLSGQAHHNYLFLIGVATLDLSIAVALLGSSFIFWNRITQ